MALSDCGARVDHEHAVDVPEALGELPLEAHLGELDRAVRRRVARRRVLAGVDADDAGGGERALERRHAVGVVGDHLRLERRRVGDPRAAVGRRGLPQTVDRVKPCARRRRERQLRGDRGLPGREVDLDRRRVGREAEQGRRAPVARREEIEIDQARGGPASPMACSAPTCGACRWSGSRGAARPARRTRATPRRSPGALSDIWTVSPFTLLFWSSKMTGAALSSGDLKSIPSIRNWPFAFHRPFARSFGSKQPVATIEVWKSSVG